MSLSRIGGFRVAGVSTCVPPHVVDNLEQGAPYGEVDVRKVVAMAGVRRRRVVDPGTTSADLCFEAAASLLERLQWAPETVTGLIFVTQSPDYWLPSTACLVHKWLGLSPQCAAFDVGLGCSGYPYGLYLGATMMHGGGHRRILVLHGETPSRFTNPDDHATTLLFGDSGSATALETAADADDAFFALHTDGTGYQHLIIRGGGFRDPAPADPRHRYLEMDGAAVFNFTVKRVPALIRDTLAYAALRIEDIDLFLFHQSNRFIMKHIARKCGLPDARVPMVIEDFGNSGGPSVPLALTMSQPNGITQAQRVMLLGYGVGLSWGAAIIGLDERVVMLHQDYRGGVPRQ